MARRHGGTVLLCAGILAIASPMAAQVPRPLGDYDAGAFASDDGALAVIAGSVLFVARKAGVGLEVWRSDGTPAGTYLIKDINPGPADSNPSTPLVVAGRACFSADDGVSGIELWCTDGTDGGTLQVADIMPGPGGSAPYAFSRFGSQFVFLANDGLTGYEPWVSDGTPAGTRRIKDIAAGAPDSVARGWVTNFVEVGDRLFFAADDGNQGPELWSTDGTEAGTTLVKEIAPGAAGAFPRKLTALASSLLFWASEDGTTRDGLWRTDGTEMGTVRLAQIRSTNDHIVSAAGVLFFTAWEDGSPPALWKSDGTQEGTTALPCPTSPSWPLLAGLSAVGDRVFFFLGTTGFSLWRLNAANGEMTLVKEFAGWGGGIGPGPVVAATTGAYFRGKEPATGDELWHTDGTTEGTRLVYDGAIGPSHATPLNLTPVDRTLYYLASDDLGVPRLWSLGGPRSFFTVNPCRLADTRRPPGPEGGPAIPASSGRSFSVVVGCGIPSTAQAVSLNVTVLGSGAPGHITVHAARTPLPGTSTINYVPGRPRANSFVVECDHLGNIQVANAQVVGAADVILDANGYYQP